MNLAVSFMALLADCKELFVAGGGTTIQPGSVETNSAGILAGWAYNRKPNFNLNDKIVQGSDSKLKRCPYVISLYPLLSAYIGAHPRTISD
jgi:hypothetical protein